MDKHFSSHGLITPLSTFHGFIDQGNGQSSSVVYVIKLRTVSSVLGTYTIIPQMRVITLLCGVTKFVLACEVLLTKISLAARPWMTPFK